MTQLSATLAALRARGEGAFVPFLVLGDPDPETSLALAEALLDAGADALELGLPFSDPPADGPVIQAASQRALGAGMTTARCLDLLETLRARRSAPVSLLGYYNPLERMGLGAFYRRAAAAGVSAVLVADAPLDESAPLVEAARASGVDPIFIASERTSDARLGRLVEAASGYLYVVAHAGVTGERDRLPPQLGATLRRLRARVSLPLLAGFGISTPGQAREALDAGADGVICGSAIVRRVAASLHDRGAMLRDVQSFASAMKQATRRGTPC